MDKSPQTEASDLLQEIFHSSGVSKVKEEINAAERKENWAIGVFHQWVLENPLNIVSLQTDGKSEAELQNNSNKGEYCNPRVDPSKVLINLPHHQLDSVLANFLTSVRKSGGRKRYSHGSLQQLLGAIQRYMRRHGRPYSILTDSSFCEVQHALTTETLERLSDFSSISSSASHVIITAEMEDELWACGALGAHSPQTLLDTQVFLFGVNFGISSGQQHRKLSLSNLEIIEDARHGIAVRYHVPCPTDTNQFYVDSRYYKEKDLISEKHLSTIMKTYVSKM